MRTLARFVSIAGHPLLLVPIAIAASGAAPARSTIAVIVAAFFAIAIYVGWGFRTGRFRDVDVSVREQRGGLYRVSLASTALATVVLFAANQRVAARGTGVAFAMLAVAAIVNVRLLKVSLHTAFAAYVVGFVARRGAIVAAAFVAAALAVAWSRVAMERHALREVVFGFVLGSIAAAAFALL